MLMCDKIVAILLRTVDEMYGMINNVHENLKETL